MSPHATYADVFPSSDPVARMVMAICMARNDLYFVNQLSSPGSGQKVAGENLYLLRLSLAHLSEFAGCISAFRGRSTACDELVATAIQQCDPKRRSALVDLLNRTGPFQYLNQLRNYTTFHYPADGETSGRKLEQCLQSCEEDEIDLVVAPTTGDCRWVFADHIALEVLAQIHGLDGTDSLREYMPQMRDAVVGGMQLCDHVLFGYLGHRGVSNTLANAIQHD